MTAQIEVRDARGTRILSNEAILVPAPEDDFGWRVPERIEWRRDLKRRCEATARLERVTGDAVNAALGVLGTVARLREERAHRLLAALVARKLHPDSGRNLLEVLRADASDPVLSAAAARALERR